MKHSRFAAVFCLAVLTVFAPAMHASLITFVAAGAGQLNSTLSGTVVIDTTTGVVQSLSLTVSNPTSSNGLPITVNQFDGFFSGLVGGTTFFIHGDNGPGTFPFVDLGLPVTTLVGYTGGSLCTPCGPFGSGFGISPTFQPSFSSGSLTPTPEPSSVALVAGALLSLATWQRRRRVGLPIWLGIETRVGVDAGFISDGARNATHAITGGR